MNKLSEIIAKKRERVATAKVNVPLDTLRVAANQRRAESVAHSLRAALSNSARTNIIAEFKRRSPSKGIIRKKADITAIVREYGGGGAAAISVLTEEDYFDGSLDDLRAVRSITTLPILRKDFIFDEYQIYESAAAGADALLLIVAALDDENLSKLRKLAEDELGMDALVEAHTRDDMRRAVDFGANIIGVNNRDLTTFDVSLETSIALAEMAPPDAILVSESGIQSPTDISTLHRAGYRGFLIGEALMKAGDAKTLLKQLTEIRQTATVDAS